MDKVYSYFGSSDQDSSKQNSSKHNNIQDKSKRINIPNAALPSKQAGFQMEQKQENDLKQRYNQLLQYVHMCMGDIVTQGQDISRIESESQEMRYAEEIKVRYSDMDSQFENLEIQSKAWLKLVDKNDLEDDPQHQENWQEIQNWIHNQKVQSQNDKNTNVWSSIVQQSERIFIKRKRIHEDHFLESYEQIDQTKGYSKPKTRKSRLR